MWKKLPGSFNLAPYDCTETYTIAFTYISTDTAHRYPPGGTTSRVCSLMPQSCCLYRTGIARFRSLFRSARI